MTIFGKIYELFAKNGLSGVWEQVIAYVYHHTKEKWRFIYFELDLTLPLYSLPDVGDSIISRRANPNDIGQIKTDLYPYMKRKQEFDKPFIEHIGKEGVECFITEKDGKLISYFMVFQKAVKSPLVKTPFKKKLITMNDAYLGNAFTIPSARGMWVIPYVLLSIIDYLHKERHAARIILLVHTDTPGAVRFFKRLGFKIIKNATSSGLLKALYNIINNKVEN